MTVRPTSLKWAPSPTANGPVNYIQIWISNGDGTFTNGQTTYPLNQQAVQLNQALIGDFDGDGKTDLALMFSAEGPTTIQVWYGDGTGNLRLAVYSERS